MKNKDNKIREPIVNPIEFLGSQYSEAKPMPQPVIDEILTTLRHARSFISSRLRMHSDSIAIYDELIKNLEEFYGK